MKTPKLFFQAATIALLAAFSACPAAVQAAGFADHHVQDLKLPCTACHKTPETMPDTKVCTGCHPADKLAASTAGVKPANPHTSPHYGTNLDCINCHVGHQPSENYCAQCHSFDFKVP